MAGRPGYNDLYGRDGFGCGGCIERREKGVDDRRGTESVINCGFERMAYVWLGGCRNVGNRKEGKQIRD